MMQKHINILIYGEVQGVFFRRTIKHEASRQKITGFVENKPDGTVYIEAESDEETLNTFLAWIRAGADGFKIIRVEVEDGGFQAFDQFIIKE